MQTSGDQRREIAKSFFRRMGGAKRYPSPHAPALMGIAALHPSYGTAVAQIPRLPPQPFNFAIEAMSTFKFLRLRPRSIVRPNYLRNRRGN
ncbi:hypothetical protein V1279_006341 [Bradyrhizobium sp. AZCC 1610]